jgi:hypothetical protein
MSFQHKLGYIALGGVIAIVGMVVGSVLTPQLVAQHETVSNVTCRELTIVDGAGNPIVRLGDGANGGSVEVMHKEGTTVINLGVMDSGGAVGVANIEGEIGVGMRADDGGNDVFVYQKNPIGVLGVALHAGVDGESVEVYNDSEQRVGSLGVIGGTGAVGVFDTEGVLASAMGVDPNGGKVVVYGKGELKSQAVLGINQNGNGTVSTRDKNGDRQ